MTPEIFENLRVKAGGISAIAREMGTYPQQVQHWKSKNSIPAKYVVKLCVLLEGEVKPYDLRPDIFLEDWTV